MRNLLSRLIVASAGVAIAACAGDPAPASAEQPIIGGAVDAGDPSVVLVIAQKPASDEATLCTGEVVSAHVVLTAAHCLDPAVVGEGDTFLLYLGDDVRQASAHPELVRAVSSVQRDPAFDRNRLGGGHDVGVVVAAQPLGLPPLPYNRAALAPSLVGSPIRLVGYGVDAADDTRATTAGIKRSVNSTLTDFDPLFLEITDPAHDVCAGDSGGPALAILDGKETIIGLASFGPTSCEATTETRVDTYAASFIDPAIAAVDPVPSPTPTNGGGASNNASGGGCSVGGRARPSLVTALVVAAALVLTKRRRRDTKPRCRAPASSA